MSALWLALHYPLLDLEAGDGPVDRPRALVHRHRVLQANPAARAAGVETGLRLATARALCEALEVREADDGARDRALRHQGRQLLALTPQVCPAPPASLLLEVGGCLKLFGGFQGLLARIDRYRLHCPFTTRLGLGPTPLAAWHLTDPPPLEGVPETARFQAWLAQLTLDQLDLEPRLRERLQAPGFRTLGELYPLPRPALGKRFGAPFLDWLQRLLGEKPDPRRPLAPPRPFRRRRDFDDPLDNLDHLHRPMETLLGELATDLERHQESVAAIRWHLYLNNGHRDTLVIRRAHPGHDVATWLDLTRRRLEHQVLEAPVLGLGLDGGRPRPRNPALADLFPDPGARAPLAGLLEKLAAEPALRLYRPDRDPGHLPEETERGRAPLERPPAPAAPPAAPATPEDRPLWLLDPPRPLSVRDAVPHWRDRPLSLFPQEERFSQPWHDQAARRYHVAHHPDGLCCWVFQDDRDGWWLQGFF
ncbi:Y-family DNA polymerase [Alloalcanivorax profundimaris]|uniref:Y-family DNA polymerase n=1 Tax=Alloalcanivorax profundimaris TaxID=2735259 RepID=UPI001886CCF6|nr:DNA polymerase Y family protein [Alloalcanivorax profundimaris]MBF1800572.1 DNA polymerase Y family protein [Alloalcanivorax profundimaris]MCQ6262292.1 DNA polymerase Y family protein [Alcanivorax sp. MM125-6]